MKTALIVIDVQEAFNMRVEAGDGRNNPDAEMNIAALLDAFRAQEAPIFHIRHASSDPESLFCKGGEGFAVQDFAREFPGEPVVKKSVNSSFIGTTLEQDLYDAGVERLVLCGVDDQSLW